MRMIDADALIEDIDGDLTDSIAEGRAIEKIMNAPTIEEHKKGKWIMQHEEETPFRWWKCSNCGQVIYSETERDRIVFHAYCSRCGADMRGET